MSEGAAQGTTRLESELLGFQAFFRFTSEHPALYRIIRQSEFVAPETLRYHYDRVAEGYVTALDAAMESGEIGQIDAEVTAYALMGLGELVGMRWILWGDGQPDARARHRRARADHPLHPRGQGVRSVGLLATASYLPERWMTAAEIAALSGIPEQVIVEKFGLRGKHIAAPDEHVSDLSVKAIERLLRRDRIRSEGDRRRHVLRLDVARPRRLAGGAAHRLSRRRDERVRDRVRQRLARHADRPADGA